MVKELLNYKELYSTNRRMNTNLSRHLILIKDFLARSNLSNTWNIKLMHMPTMFLQLVCAEYRLELYEHRYD